MQLIIPTGCLYIATDNSSTRTNAVGVVSTRIRGWL